MQRVNLLWFCGAIRAQRLPATPEGFSLHCLSLWPRPTLYLIPIPQSSEGFCSSFYQGISRWFLMKCGVMKTLWALTHEAHTSKIISVQSIILVAIVYECRSDESDKQFVGLLLWDLALRWSFPAVFFFMSVQYFSFSQPQSIQLCSVLWEFLLKEKCQFRLRGQ